MIIIGLIIVFTIVIFSSVLVWRLSGKPFYRISLLGTDYIENADELKYINEQLENKLYLIKKYKHSTDKIYFGFGGGSGTDDLYLYGIADIDKNILIEPKFRSIYSFINSKKEAIIYGFPYDGERSKEPTFYKVAHGKLESISEKDSR